MTKINTLILIVFTTLFVIGVLIMEVSMFSKLQFKI